MVRIVSDEDLDKLRQHVDETRGNIAVTQSSENYYYWIRDDDLTKKIENAFQYYKDLVEEISRNEFTLLHEFSVTHDPDDQKYFVIARISMDTNIVIF